MTTLFVILGYSLGYTVLGGITAGLVYRLLKEDKDISLLLGLILSISFFIMLGTVVVTMVEVLEMMMMKNELMETAKVVLEK